MNFLDIDKTGGKLRNCLNNFFLRCPFIRVCISRQVDMKSCLDKISVVYVSMDFCVYFSEKPRPMIRFFFSKKIIEFFIQDVWIEIESKKNGNFLKSYEAKHSLILYIISNVQSFTHMKLQYLLSRQIIFHITIHHPISNLIIVKPKLKI